MKNRIKAALARSRSEGSVLRTFASRTAVLGVIGSLVTQAFVSISPAVAQAPTCAGVAATIVGTPGNANDVLVGTEGDDVIAGLGGNDEILGRGGNDTICGGAGADRILGGPGDDLILGGSGLDRIRGDDGNDQIQAGTDNDLAFGGLGNDDVRGQDGDDILLGGGGDDTILGGLGNDQLLGDDGNDTIRGGPGNDRMLGGREGVLSGADSLSGEGGADTLIALDGITDDNLNGGLGVNNCVFDEGDQLTGGCL
ncbi:MAG: calcium-binding protein, partial [bacterium]